MITRRDIKGSPLTAEELDANWDALATKIVTVAEDTTLSDAHYTVLVDAAEGNVSVTLPSAASAFANGYGRVYNIKKIDATANVVTVDGDGDEIDGEATLAMNLQYQSVTVQSNGSVWSVL
jgi:hypothetical protein